MIQDVVVDEVEFRQGHLGFSDNHLRIFIYRLKYIENMRVRSMEYYKEHFLTVEMSQS